MHEANFTESIVQSILEQLKSAPAGRVTRVRVTVGEMLHLNPDSVLTHFQSLCRGTSLDGVALELEEVPVSLRCLACGWSGEAEDHHLLFCSACSSIAVDIVAGRDVIIEQIELEAAPV